MKSRLIWIVAIGLIAACTHATKPSVQSELPTPSRLQTQCDTYIGPPRVLQPAENIWVAIGYDLANVVLIRTSAGNVIVDAAMSPTRAKPIREALLRESPGPIVALIYTHSHLDHIGGASAWVDSDTQIWATESLSEHLFKQYGVFRPAETARSMRQFGKDVSDDAVPCSALGRRLDFEAASKSGVRIPTHTFAGQKQLTFGDTEIRLVEAHGETHDQLFVWIPSQRAVLPGDNFYHTFPNLYTIRGTQPRPVADWIDSLDEMRRRDPALLIPSHTVPVTDERDVSRVLTDYRDGIQWIHDAVVRGANAGRSVDAMATEIGLPKHLMDVPALDQLYGQIDWSVRAIYTNKLGWFDGDAADLYPLPPTALASRTVAAMGGVTKVVTMADTALANGEPRWAIHLLRHVMRLPNSSDTAATKIANRLAAAYRTVAADVANTNGRAYLLTAANALQGNPPEIPTPSIDDELLAAIPLDVLFTVMATRLRPAAAMDVHETAIFRFTDVDETYILTVRHGVLEVAKESPLPGTPTPVATLTTDSRTYKEIALREASPAAALARGDLSVEGSWIGLIRFLGRFQTGL